MVIIIDPTLAYSIVAMIGICTAVMITMWFRTMHWVLGVLSALLYIILLILSWTILFCDGVMPI